MAGTSPAMTGRGFPFRLLAPALLLFALLSACGLSVDAEQARVCRLALPALNPDGGQIRVVRTVPWLEAYSIRIEYRVDREGAAGARALRHLPLRRRGAVGEQGRSRRAVDRGRAGRRLDRLPPQALLPRQPRRGGRRPWPGRARRRADRGAAPPRLRAAADALRPAEDRDLRPPRRRLRPRLRARRPLQPRLRRACRARRRRDRRRGCAALASRRRRRPCRGFCSEPAARCSPARSTAPSAAIGPWRGSAAAAGSRALSRPSGCRSR